MNGSAAQRFCLLVLLFLACAFAANAQTATDENFTLNITEERVTETNFERSTEVKTDANSTVAVRIGASARAGSITLTLRGITGNVRFRASLEKIQNLIFKIQD